MSVNASDSYPADIQVQRSTWIDLTTDYPAASGAPSWVENKGPGNIVVAYSSSAVAPTGGGVLLAVGEGTSGTAAHIWVMSEAYVSSVGIGLSVPSSAITIADGADITLGAKNDLPANNCTSSWSIVSMLKGLYSLLNSTLKVGGNVSVQGVTVAGNADLDAPIKIGGYASDTAPDAVANGARANNWLGRNGQTAAVIVNMDGSIPSFFSMQDITYSTNAHAYYQAMVTTSPQTLGELINGAIPAWATMAFITPETGSVRYRCDTTVPAATTGQPIAQGQAWPVQGAASLAALQLIAAENVTVSIEFRG